MKYKVRYVHEVEITYDAIVEADSPEEAKAKMEEFDFESEEEVKQDGMSMRVESVEEAEDEE